MPLIRPIVLLTDFGPSSAYVGQMKLVFHRLSPKAPVVDLAHDLPPHNVAAASMMLEGAARFLPHRSIVVAVVDPGVGSDRRIVAARYRRGLYVLAPDNGFLSAATGLGKPAAVRVVENDALFLKPVSPVFHGRDIFAPIAARLSRGFAFAKLGPVRSHTALVSSAWPDPVVERSIQGVRVVHVDRFGNLITNLRASAIGKRRVLEATCKRRRFPFATYYGTVKKGGALSLIGSYGRLELALREASAAQKFCIAPGAKVNVLVDS